MLNLKCTCSLRNQTFLLNREFAEQQSKVPEKSDVLVLSIPSIKEIGVVKEAPNADPLPKLCVNKVSFFLTCIDILCVFFRNH